MNLLMEHAHESNDGKDCQDDDCHQNDSVPPESPLRDAHEPRNLHVLLLLLSGDQEDNHRRRDENDE